MTRTITAIVAIAGWTALVTSAPAQTYYHYECADGASFEVGLYPDTKAAFLQIDGKSLQLPKRFSLTSQRFAQNGVTFSMKSGGAATIRRAGKTSQCKVN
jgi:hypothetical protein